MVVCECGLMVSKLDLEQHKMSSCSRRKVVCSYCKEDVVAMEMDQHINVSCSKYPVDCPNNCGEKIRRADMEEHINSETGDCKKMPCPFGCPDTGEEHTKDQAAVHCTILFEMITSIQNAMLKHDRNTSQTDRNAIAERIETLEKSVEDVQEIVTTVSATLGRQQRNSSPANRQAVPQSGMAMAAAPNAGELPNTHPDVVPEQLSMDMLKEKQTIIEGLAAVLNREVEKLIIDQNNMVHQRTINTDSIDQLKTRVTSLERGLALKDISLAEQDLRLRELETTSFDGTLMWALNDFSRKRQEAINGRTLSIYSTPFYTSRAGYKMCTRIYLNGDGVGKGTHVSLFFVIMRGQYDAILPWPFKQKVTLMLLNQNNGEHVIDAFRPDPNSLSFRQPQSAVNIASGIPLFCPLSRLEDRHYTHVKDDTMFLKIIVDLSGL